MRSRFIDLDRGLLPLDEFVGPEADPSSCVVVAGRTLSIPFSEFLEWASTLVQRARDEHHLSMWVNLRTVIDGSLAAQIAGQPKWPMWLTLSPIDACENEEQSRALCDAASQIADAGISMVPHLFLAPRAWRSWRSVVLNWLSASHRAALVLRPPLHQPGDLQRLYEDVSKLGSLLSDLLAWMYAERIVELHKVLPIGQIIRILTGGATLGGASQLDATGTSAAEGRVEDLDAFAAALHQLVEVEIGDALYLPCWRGCYRAAVEALLPCIFSDLVVAGQYARELDDLGPDHRFRIAARNGSVAVWSEGVIRDHQLNRS